MTGRLVYTVEELAANAWPAAVVQVVDGWRLRYNWGVTRRANSVWPNDAHDEHALAEKLDCVEGFYTRRGLPARYQICPAARPADLDVILADCGYTLTARTAVQTATISTVLAGTAVDASEAVVVAEAFDEQWFGIYCLGEHVGAGAEARRDILHRIGPRSGYARLEVADRTMAVGLGVAERGWVGIFGLTTLPEFRRRGAATAIVRSLARWGREQGARSMYLQVMEENTAACSLYAGLGFKTLYCYHYREGIHPPR